MKKVKPLPEFFTDNNNEELTEFELLESEFETVSRYKIEYNQFYLIIPSEKENNEDTEIKLSNCVFKFICNIRNGTNDSQRIVYLKRQDGRESFLIVSSSELKPAPFQTTLMSYGCIFSGKNSQLFELFEILMSNEKEAKRVDTIGYYDELDIYIFSDCVITHKNNEPIYANKYGIVNINDDSVYLPSASKINSDDSKLKFHSDYKYQPGTLTFKQWAYFYYKVFGDNALIGINYAILCIFRDIVFNFVKFFPFIFLFGEAGTGKSTFASAMLRLFINDTIGDPLSNATDVGLSRKVNQRINSLFYLKEFKSNVEEKIEDFILSGYDGSGRLTGNMSNDNSTKSMLILSGWIMDGNDLPASKKQIFQRMLLLTFKKSKWDEENSEYFRNLEKFIEQGLNDVLKEIYLLRDEFKKSLSQYFWSTVTKLKAAKELQKLEERPIKHAALIITAQKILSHHVDFPVSLENLEEVVIKNQLVQYELVKKSEDLHVFWKSFERYLEDMNKTEDFYFQCKNPELDELGSLFLNYSKQYSKFYVKYCKEVNIRPMTEQGLYTLLFESEYEFFVKSTQNKRGITHNVQIPNGPGSRKNRSMYKFQFPIDRTKDGDFDSIYLNIDGILIDIDSLNY